MKAILSTFHPVVADWFNSQFDAPSDVQCQAWPAIQSGQNTLIAAPTGSGKTLAAFLAVIDQLVKQGLDASLPDNTLVLYISPLKALSNDIRKNLEHPLQGISFALLEAALPGVAIRAQTRTGDTSQLERISMKRLPPHILVTTPESLFILLTSDAGRLMLKTVTTVIVDEIHALAGNKRGAHLMLSLERLSELCGKDPIRIGLSATQKPLSAIANYLTGQRIDSCKIIDTGYKRQRDINIEVTSSPLEAIMATEVWTELYDRLEQLIVEHKTTLIFVNTRRLAERAAAALADRLGEEAVTAHHGSLAKEHRLSAENRLKQGQLKALVATASLELGIDIGDVDLVCQLGSPRGIAAFLQRVGRSGHNLGGTPKGRLFPLSRDDLLECTALLAAISQDQLDSIHFPEYPLDVLAQQVVAEVACQEWAEHALYHAFSKAWPYKNLSFEKYMAVIAMLSEGYHTRRGRRGAYIHRDGVHGILRARKGARLTAIMNGGAIPDHFDYDVIMQPDGLFVGTLNEDFAFESLPGDIFQLGNMSYRMLNIEQGKVYVEDAHGQPPNIPFWFGEAPGRTWELSEAVSALTEKINTLLELGNNEAFLYIHRDLALPVSVAEQLIHYLTNAKAALGVLPTFQHIIFERFFDEVGDLHFVIHSVYGSRINKAWGLALRKRFCRQFNFELQAAANENNIVLSLGPTHSFPLLEPAGYLKSATVKAVLVQALLAAPMFPTRWRWVANTSLAIPRMRVGKKVPAFFQRNDAEDLISVIFPDQLACAENMTGEREVPDHPLVHQTLWDCMHELMDIDGLINLLRNIESGNVQIIAKELTSPSPLSEEIINAKPYAFLDDTPAEERRTLAIQQRRLTNPKEAAEIGRLNPAAIEQVSQEAWPDLDNENEVHDAMLVMAFMTEQEVTHYSCGTLLAQLSATQRTTCLTLSTGERLWVSAERLHEFQLLFPNAICHPKINALLNENLLTYEKVLQDVIVSRMAVLGVVTVQNLAKSMGLDLTLIEPALLALEQQGSIIRGQFTSGAQTMEWCERALLARMHRYSLNQLRKEIEPVSLTVFMRFLFQWHGLHQPLEGEKGLNKVLHQLEGFNAPAHRWESDILVRRVKPFFASELDQLCSSGKFLWLRIKQLNEVQNPKSAGKVTPIAIISRPNFEAWRHYSPLPVNVTLSSNAEKVTAALSEWGASFFQELQQETGLLKTQLEAALGELTACGLVTSDSYQGIRTLLLPERILQQRSKRYPSYDAMAEAGRWSLLRPLRNPATDTYTYVEPIAKTLLLRYGVVFRKLLDREEGIPSWRELLYVYRRMEARGEIRGGRFVQGFSGEQFALPDAVNYLKKLRKEAETGNLIMLSASDPLNLIGILTPGERITSSSKQRLIYRDGKLLAYGTRNKVDYVQSVDEKYQQQIKARMWQK